MPIRLARSVIDVVRISVISQKTSAMGPLTSRGEIFKVISTNLHRGRFYFHILLKIKDNDPKKLSL